MLIWTKQVKEIRKRKKIHPYIWKNDDRYESLE